MRFCPRRLYLIVALIAVGNAHSVRAQPQVGAVERLAGLRSYVDCTLIPADWADGDSFSVMLADGRSVTVRLYGADCMEWHVNQPSDARRLRAQRRYFGISEWGGDARESIAAAKDFGRLAAARVGELLAEPFTVFTADADAGGSGRYKRIYAFVVTAEGRDLASQLIEEGLARAYGVLRRGPDGAHRDEIRARLSDLELTAARQGRGIWALTDWEKLPEERRIDREEEAELAEAIGPSLQHLESFRVDPNTASRDELMRLPGIGEVTAAHIIEGREEGTYASPEDLLRVRGIGAKTLEKIRDYLELDADAPD